MPRLLSPAPPSCMQSRCHPRQGGQRLPHTTTGSWGWKRTRASRRMHAVSFSVLFAFSIYRCTSYVCVQFILAHKHAKRPAGWGRKRAGSVCLSLVFQQEAPGPARHLRGAATADKEEAINPQKITRTDTLSHRNTTTQPGSFLLQCRQRKKDGERGWAHLVKQQDTQKASSPL